MSYWKEESMEWNFWSPKWYEDKSTEFLEDRYERKPYATAFIVFSTVVFVVSATRVVIGRPFDWLLFGASVAVMLVGCAWFRIAYLSQEELKRRGKMDDTPFAPYGVRKRGE